MAEKETKKMVDYTDSIEDILSWQSLSSDKVQEYQTVLDVKKHPVSSRKGRPIYRMYTNDKGEEVRENKGITNPVIIFDPIASEIVEKATIFTAGNKPIIDYIHKGSAKAKEERIKEILTDNKELSLNSDVYSCLYAFSEVAELWYINPYKLEDGIKEYECHVLSPMLGDTLYPNIDEYGKMQSFAYSNVKVDLISGDEVTELVYITKDHITTFESEDGADNWEQTNQVENLIKKLPVIYTTQGKADFEDVINSIYRMEAIASNAGASADKVAFPDLIIEASSLEGTDIGTEGESSTYVIGGGGKMYYNQPNGDTNIVDTDYKRNEDIVRNRTSTPDISLENLKGLGQISGATLERMLTDAILKARNKITKYLVKHHERRMNVINSLVSFHEFKGVTEDIKFSIDIEPYVPLSKADKLEEIMQMVGRMPMKYIIKRIKNEVDKSIDEDEILQWLEEERQRDNMGDKYF